jgi:hypothetical protein
VCNANQDSLMREPLDFTSVGTPYPAHGIHTRLLKASCGTLSMVDSLVPTTPDRGSTTEILAAWLLSPSSVFGLRNRHAWAVIQVLHNVSYILVEISRDRGLF